eukprot:TRINITY_DN29632_c0_g1_i1.p1 TRINITY_DN29632_c0_g1~~TRINITY_DN29632_c0_g1_i1.p1  ORF type:complete len:443 (+),score=139.91 TRINITY_DN29632_c0_g1_i1:55-1383(+)
MDGIDMSVLNGAEFRIRKGPRAEQVAPVPTVAAVRGVGGDSVRSGRESGASHTSIELSSEQDSMETSNASSLQPLECGSGGGSPAPTDDGIFDLDSLKKAKLHPMSDAGSSRRGSSGQPALQEDPTPDKRIQEAEVLILNSTTGSTTSTTRAKLPLPPIEADYDDVNLEELKEVTGLDETVPMEMSPQFSSPGEGTKAQDALDKVISRCVGAYDYREGEEDDEDDGPVAPPRFIEGKLHVPRPAVQLFPQVAKRCNSSGAGRRRVDDKWRHARELEWVAPKKIRPEEDAVWEKELCVLAKQLEVVDEKEMINVDAVVRRLYPSKAAIERKRRELEELHAAPPPEPVKRRTRSAGAGTTDRYTRPLNKEVPTYTGYDKTAEYTFKPQLTPHDYTTSNHLNHQLGSVWDRLTKEKPKPQVEEPKPAKRKTSKPPVGRRKRDVIR